MMTPSSATAPSGPSVPQYLLPLTTRYSQWQLLCASTSKAITSSPTAGTPVMVHASLLP